MLIRNIATTLLIFLVPHIANSTCIGIMIVNNKIYVAADSRRTVSAVNINNGKVSKSYQSICKINLVGNVYFAISGYDDKYLREAAEESLKVKKSKDSAVIYYARKMKAHYKVFLAKAKIHDRASYDYYLKNALASVSFFGFQDNLAYMTVIDFLLSEVNGKIVIKEKINKKKTDAFLGVSDHILSLSEKDDDRLFSQSLGVVYYLEKLITLEINKHPEKVNYPIDLLEISNTKATWIRKKEKCENLL